MTTHIIDRFAGPGGWSQGLKALGQAEVGIELDDAAVATARAAGHERVQADIALLDPVEFADLYCDGRVDGGIDSPPCPGFSAAGKGLGKLDLEMLLWCIETIGGGFFAVDRVLSTVRERQHDTRSALTLEPLRWALALEPTWLAWEQVPAVLPLWEACAVVLRARGWNVWVGVVNAEQYGVPQARRRAVLRAHREREMGRPTPTHSQYHRGAPTRLDEGVERWLPFASQFPWAWQPTPATPETRIDDMQWVYHRPSPTIVGTFCPDVVAAPGYRKPGDGPRQKAKGSVRITLEDAAALQSFPRDYPWNGGPRDAQGRKWQQVGDAVPPLLAEAILRDLL